LATGHNYFGVSRAVMAAVCAHMIRTTDPELGKTVNEGNICNLEKDIGQMGSAQAAKFRRKHHLSERSVSEFVEKAILEKLGATDASEGLSRLIEKLESGEIMSTSQSGAVSGMSAFVSHAVEEKIERDERQKTDTLT